METYTVYLHISPDGKRYYGATKQNPKYRWRNGYGYKTQKFFWEAIQEFGWNNIQHIIIARGLTKEEAHWLEIELIKEWNTRDRDKGYNITKGGAGANGRIVSEETKNKIRFAISGENHPMYGKHHTEEAKKKISENHWDCSGENNPKYWKGKQFSEEHKNKISKANRGENNPMYGKEHTEETKKKMSKNHADFSGKNHPQAKSVICITTSRIFHTAKEGAEYYGIASSSITNCCKGNRKSAGKLNGTKLVWRYLVWNHNKIYRKCNK